MVPNGSPEQHQLESEDEAPEEIGFEEGKQLVREQEDVERNATRKTKKRKSSHKSVPTTKVVVEERVETDEDDSVVQDSIEGEVDRCSGDEVESDLGDKHDEPTVAKKRRIKKMIFPDKTLEVIPISKLSKMSNKLKLSNDAVNFKQQMMSRVKRQPSHILFEKLQRRRLY